MVVVSHREKFIFLKTRKTAGTSIEMLLEPFCVAPNHVVTEKTDCLISDYGIVGARKIDIKETKRRDIPFANHMSARKIKKRLGDEIWESHTKITAIRNPFSRAVSHFHFRNRKRNLEQVDADGIRQLFRRFILRGNVLNDYDVVHIDDNFEPSIVIRFEKLVDDMNALSARFDLGFDYDSFPTAKTLGHNNNLNVPDYFDTETTQFVKEKWAWVFDRFNYSDKPADYTKV